MGCKIFTQSDPNLPDRLTRLFLLYDLWERDLKQLGGEVVRAFEPVNNEVNHTTCLVVVYRDKPREEEPA
jgi:hypothetical protein